MAATELLMLTGERYEVGGEPTEVEKTVVAAARGSIMQFAWLEEAASGRSLAINPAHVVSLRSIEPD